jgi:hypothetical protein
MLAMTRSRCFSLAAFAASGAHFGAENKSWLDLLKEGFNCRDGAHTWCRSGNHPW